MAKQFQTVTRIGPFSKGEIPDTLVLTFKDADGNAIDLAGFTSQIQIEALGQTVDGLGAGTDSLGSATGEIDYEWAAADFTTAALYRLQGWVGDAGTRLYGSNIFEYWVVDNTEAPAI